MTAVEARARGGGPSALRNGLASGGLVVAIVVLGAVLLGGALPWRLTTVDTASMDPTIPAGSLAVERSEPTSALHVGQVITYLPPGHAEELTHRVSWVGWDGDHQAMFRTRGDANPGEDPWQAIAVAPDVWTVAAHVPGLGRPFAAARDLIAQPAVLLVLAALALLALWIRPQQGVLRRLRRRLTRASSRSRLRARALNRRTSALALVAALTVTGSVALQAVEADTAQAAFSTRTSRAHAIRAAGLSTPTLMTARAGCVLGVPRVSLVWTSPADGRTSVAVQRKQGVAGTWLTLPPVLPDTTSFVDTGSLGFATTYYYRVQHQAGPWAGTASNAVMVNTLIQSTCLAA